MKTLRLFKFGIVLCLFLGGYCYGQERWALEFRPNLSFPLEKVNDENLQTGYGFDLRVSYKLMPHLRAYGGWYNNQFKSKTNYREVGFTINENGFPFGFELTLPISKPPITYFGYVGGKLTNIAPENPDLTFDIHTNYGFGWQIGMGVDYVFIDNWSLRPGVRYESVSRRIEINSASNEIDLSVLAISIGVLYAF